MEGDNLEILTKYKIKFIYYNDIVHVLIDDVANNLGMFANINNVRWNRINKYLSSVGYLEKVHSNSYIPLNVFYKLVFIANTKQAKELKNEIADIISTYN